MADITIQVRDNGPYLIRGGATVTDAEGKTYEVKDVIALCRCGQSGNKPFCDGTHNGAGFQSVCRAAVE
jgi:CDGSH-type Zn-finger protein